MTRARRVSCASSESSRFVMFRASLCAGTTTEFGRFESRTVTFTYWPGHSARSSFGNDALRVIVPVAELVKGAVMVVEPAVRSMVALLVREAARIVP